MEDAKTSCAVRRAAVRALWQQLIGEFETSGKTGTAFCRDRGLSVCQFRYWRKVLRPVDGLPTGFVELSSVAPEPDVWISCGRWQVHVGERFDSTVLRRVVEALT